jgi:hypothetical protein
VTLLGAGEQRSGAATGWRWMEGYGAELGWKRPSGLGARWAGKYKLIRK